MKEIKVITLAMLTMGLVVFTSCDDDDKKFNPDQVFTEALQTKYPNARVKEWEKRRTYHVAECIVDNKELDVWFSETAQWIMTETELTRNNLPAEVEAAFTASDYSTWRVDDVDLLEYPTRASVYVIEVEQGNIDIDLYFSPTGEFVDEKDVTNSDDTHWPE